MVVANWHVLYLKRSGAACAGGQFWRSSAGGGAAGKEAELVVSSFCKGRKSCADAIQRSICIGMDFDAVWTDTFSSLAQFPYLM